jgi:biotin transporter BioY
MLVAKFSFGKAVAIGVIPTLPGGVIKILAAAFIAGRLREKIKLPA